MATLAVAAGGAALGGLVGWGFGATMMGIALGWTVGAYIGQTIFGPEMPDVQGPRLSDLSVQSSAYNEPMVIPYGAIRTAGNIIWSAGIEEHKNEEQMGGKGMTGGDATKTTYKYTCSFAVAICAGPIDGINRIWMDGKLFQDIANDSKLKFGRVTAGKVKNLIIYRGTREQEPDPLIESHEGVGYVPAYRDTAYAVFEDLKLEDYGNRIPNIEFEILSGLEEFEAKFEIVPHYCSAVKIIDNYLIACEYEYWFLYFYNLDALPLERNEEGYLEVTEGHYFGKHPEEKTVSEWYTLDADKDPEESYFALSSQYKTLNFAGTVHVDQDFYSDKDVDDLDPHEYMLYYGNYRDFAVCRLPEVSNLYDCIIFWSYATTHEMHFTDKNEYYPVAVCTYYGPTHSVGNILRRWGSDVPSHAGCIAGYNGKILRASSFDNIVEIYDDSFNWEQDLELPQISSKQSISVTSEGNLVVLVSNKHFYIYKGISSELLTYYGYKDQLTQVSLADIVADISERDNLQPEEYDVSELEQYYITGFAITKPMSGQDALKPLMKAYQFDVVEAEGQIKYFIRGKPLERSFVEDDLAAHEQGGDIPAAVTTTRMQKNQLPTKIVVQYQDRDSNYQVASQYASRVTQDHENTKDIQLPIVMKANEALRIAETLLATAWNERNSHSVSVLTENIDLLPGTVIDAAGYRMIASEISTKLPGIIDIKGPSEEPSSYESEAEAEAPYVAEQPLPGNIPNTFYVMMNLPSISNVDETPGIFIAPYVYKRDNADNWGGAVIYTSNDEGDSWYQADIVTSQTLIAKVKNSPGLGPTTRWDFGNEIIIDPINNRDDLLVSVSKTSALAGENTAAIGNSSDGWEIISFLDVQDNEDGTYTLSGMIRGRRGTERAMNFNKDKLILLKDYGIGFVKLSNDEVGVKRDYKIVPIGGDLISTATTSWKNNGDIIKPWSPVHIKGIRNNDGDLTITWLRRSRAEESWNIGDVPLYESTEEYELDIYDGDTVVRTMAVSGEDSDQKGITYTTTQQQDDFGAVQDSVTMKVYQISDVIGRGYPGEATV